MPCGCRRMALLACIGVAPAANSASELYTSRSTTLLRSQTYENVRTVGYWRFEADVPSAYWRAEAVLADHSGLDHHLDWSEGVSDSLSESMVSFISTLDAIPQATSCESNDGVGCTYLQSEGYFKDKMPNASWVGSNFSRGAYRSSPDVPA